MSDYKATPEQWRRVVVGGEEDISMYACVLELRARVEALEAHAGSLEVTAPAPVAGGLVERITLAIDRAPFDEGDHLWDEARAAILEVARWLDTRGQHGCSLWLREELEAGR